MSLGSAIEFPSGVAFGQKWYSPKCHYSETTFQYPRAFSMLSDTMLFAWYKTGDDSLLEGIQAVANSRREFLLGNITDEEEGSLGWAANKIRSHLVQTLSKHWLLTQSDTYLDILEVDADTYFQYRRTLDEELLIDSLEPTSRALSVNQPMYTSEVRFTDRVVKFHSKYFNLFSGGALERAEVPLRDTCFLGGME